MNGYAPRDVYHNQMHEILRQELWHSTRIGRLSDNVKTGGAGFEHETADLHRIIFGSCEYVKDGLIPLTELLGHHAWYERMRGIVDDMINHAPYETRYGRMPLMSDEVNGEFLQALTREPRYVKQAMAIVDFYFKEVIPKSNGLPAHIWDLDAGQPETDMFNFADHGNEIVGGLPEWVLFLKETNDPRFEDFSADDSIGRSVIRDRPE